MHDKMKYSTRLESTITALKKKKKNGSLNVLVFLLLRVLETLAIFVDGSLVFLRPRKFLL